MMGYMFIYKCEKENVGYDEGYLNESKCKNILLLRGDLWKARESVSPARPCMPEDNNEAL